MVRLSPLDFFSSSAAARMEADDKQPPPAAMAPADRKSEVKAEVNGEVSSEDTLVRKRNKLLQVCTLYSACSLFKKKTQLIYNS
jgi:hypothetical protein